MKLLITCVATTALLLGLACVDQNWWIFSTGYIIAVLTGVTILSWRKS